MIVTAAVRRRAFVGRTLRVRNGYGHLETPTVLLTVSTAPVRSLGRIRERRSATSGPRLRGFRIWEAWVATRRLRWRSTRQARLWVFRQQPRDRTMGSFGHKTAAYKTLGRCPGEHIALRRQSTI